MKKSKLWLTLCASLILSGLTTSCSDKDEPKHDDTGSKIELPDSRMFILNVGLYYLNNSNISFYGPKDGTLIEDIFFKQNGKYLGDTAQDMIACDDKIYVAVYGSNYLTKLNAAGVEEDRVLFSSDPDLQGGVRYLAEEDDYIYASFHGGALAKINKKDLTIEKKLTNLGVNLEGVAVENGKLYVANAYSESFDAETGYNTYNYFDEMFVINLRDFTLSETLTVATNPNLVEEEDDKIFVIGWGNYIDKFNELQMIEPKLNNKVTSLGSAYKMAVGNDKVYILNSQSDWTQNPPVTNNTFSYYDIKAGKLVETSFMKDTPAELYSSQVQMIEVDDVSGDIYIGIGSYEANGEIYRFTKDGNFVTKFDSQGLYPSKAVFLDLQ